MLNLIAGLEKAELVQVELNGEILVVIKGLDPYREDFSYTWRWGIIDKPIEDISKIDFNGFRYQETKRGPSNATLLHIVESLGVDWESCFGIETSVFWSKKPPLKVKMKEVKQNDTL
jgi:hypothetical protein